MHIPDGFLSTPVWAALDAAAVPAAVACVRRAQGEVEDRKIPLLGVMGAFVFAAQMVNFPVAAGTSSHLVGSALLAVTLGPAAAATVMTAILAIQALVFQDGGILALGANVLNMAVAGVLCGYLPYRMWGASKPALFASGAISVMVASLLAITELLLSGIPIPRAVLGLSAGVFLVSALLEGAITVAVVGALEAIQPDFIRPAGAGGRAVTALSLAALLLAAGGVMFASTFPDGLEKLASNLGISSRARALVAVPLADYEAAFFQSDWLRKAAGGLIGLVLIWGACLALGRRLAARQRSV